MRRVVVDSMAIDPIADLPGAYKIVRTAIDQGQLEVLFTHVNVDELAATPDEDRRSLLLKVLLDLGRLVPTGAFVLGSSRLGFARIGGDQESFEVFRSRNVDKHTRDALIAATAQHEQCELVTAEHRLRKRARERGIAVIEPKQLLVELGLEVNNFAPPCRP